MDHEMSLFGEAFDRIASGKKVIEVRLFDEKRQLIKLGDKITFLKLPEKIDFVIVKVIGLSCFGSFENLFKTFEKSKFGHPESRTLKDQIDAMYEVYTPEREKEYGVIAIHIEKVS